MKNYKIKEISKQCFGYGTYCCDESTDGEGRIFIGYGECDKEVNGIKHALLSNDNGKTFEKVVDTNRMSCGFKKLQDGSYLAMGFSNIYFHHLFNQDNDIPYCLIKYRANTFDDIISGNVKTEFETVDIPGLTWGFGDSNNKGAGARSGWLQLSNGDILVTMYGQFKDDTTLCPYFQKWGVYDFYLYRTWCLISHDGGKTFEFLSVIADVQTYPIPDINGEGYCECEVVEIGDGHLVAALRTCGHNIKSPLYISHSYDNGKTWSAPMWISEWGVLPRILKMKSGRLVIATGHPDIFIHISDDNGETWSDKVIVEDDPGDWGNTTSGYNAIFESEEGVISLVYDASNECLKTNPEGELHRFLYVKNFRIED